MNPWLIGGLALLGSLAGAGLPVLLARCGWLPWRWHTHIDITTWVPADRWERLFDTVADAAHALDEEVSVAGSIKHPPYPHIEVIAFGLRRRAVDALTDRVADALAAATWPACERLVRVKRRCRC